MKFTRSWVHSDESLPFLEDATSVAYMHGRDSSLPFAELLCFGYAQGEMSEGIPEASGHGEMAFCESLLGMFPIVTYTGYADLFRNVVSWVLSEEMMTGTIVAPGCVRSTRFYPICLAIAAMQGLRPCT